jgi:hypothetical protein
MKKLLILAVVLLFANMASAQYIYTIKADSVKITNNCDTAELILENHTQNVLGFLYNKGKGRTEFRKINKLNDSTMIFGDDTIVVHGSGWRLTGNYGTNPAVNYIGTNDSAAWVVKTFLKERMRITANGHVGFGPNIGANSSLNSVRFFVAHSDTISTSVGAVRQAHFSRNNIGTNNMTVGSNHNNGTLFTAYLRLDTNTTFAPNYQSGTLLGSFSSGGFLDKTNVPIQTVTAASDATNGITVDGTKFLIQGGDTKNINGFIAGKKYIMEVNSFGTAQHFADVVLGITVRKTPGGSSYVFTNKYGAYILPVKDGSNVTNGYSIYSEGASDSAWFAGVTRTKIGYVTDKLKVGGAGDGNAATVFKLGENHWSSAMATIYRITDVLTTSNPKGNRGLLAIGEIKTPDNNVTTGGYYPAGSINGYISPDANYTITSNDVQATTFGLHSEGGFLNKGGVSTTNITIPSTAPLAATLTQAKVNFQGNTQNVSGYFCAIKTMLERNTSAGSITNFADMVIGVTRTVSSTFTINTRRGIHIVPISASSPNPYSIYSEGTADTALFAGYMRVGSLTPTTPNAKLYVSGTGRFTDTLTATTMGNPDSSNRVATTAFVKNVMSSPALAVVSAGTSDFTATAGAITKLPDLTGVGSHSVTLPSAASHSGERILLWNRNSSGNSWTFASAVTLPDGTTSTSIANQTTIELISDGSIWIKWK